MLISIEEMFKERRMFCTGNFDNSWSFNEVSISNDYVAKRISQYCDQFVHLSTQAEW